MAARKRKPGRGVMSAAAIAVALGGVAQEGRGWRCRCPLHGGRSLTLRDGEGGRVLVTCWGGCERLDLLAELRRRGLLNRNFSRNAPRPFTKAPRDDTSRIAWARAIWRESRRSSGTIVETYLATRGIPIEVFPASIRFHPFCPRPKDHMGNVVPPMPAMVSLVEHANRGPVAVHCTYLRNDGTGKADLPKARQRAAFGPVGGGAVSLGMVSVAAEWLAVSEGVETGLSIAVACALPVWAALSTGGLKKLVLPLSATHVIICSDHDTNGAGQEASNFAARRFVAEGRRVRIATPPKAGTDFNDLLNLKDRFDEERRDVE
jgi:putative DNA primase/helicase